ncbi:putative polyprotein [Yichang virus]|uniref:Putative polyprotein n=1 Tax=Yichang virus TaxID=2053026 RepID=A0A2H4NG12_9NIDO|nr:putative polyprotein [Yichang virus]ATV90886.1 putative polyprotein [Yichang virus]
MTLHLTFNRTPKGILDTPLATLFERALPTIIPITCGLLGLFVLRMFRWLLVKCRQRNGPLATTVLQRLCQRVYRALTRKNLYYVENLEKKRNETRVNLFLSENSARFDRTHLIGYCRRCHLYGHTTDSKLHGINLEAVTLAKYCNTFNCTSFERAVKLAYTVAHIRSFEKNPKAFMDFYGHSNQVLPTKIAIAPIASVKDLKMLDTQLGTTYVNNTVTIPHHYFYAYATYDELVDLVVKLTMAVDYVTIYTTHDMTNLNAANFVVSDTVPTFTNTCDIYDVVCADMKKLTRDGSVLRMTKAQADQLKDNEDETASTTSAQDPADVDAVDPLKQYNKGKQRKPRQQNQQTNGYAKQNYRYPQTRGLGYGAQYNTYGYCNTQNVQYANITSPFGTPSMQPPIHPGPDYTPAGFYSSGPNPQTNTDPETSNLNAAVVTPNGIYDPQPEQTQLTDQFPPQAQQAPEQSSTVISSQGHRYSTKFPWLNVSPLALLVIITAITLPLCTAQNCRTYHTSQTISVDMPASFSTRDSCMLVHNITERTLSQFNYMLTPQECFSVDGVEWSPLTRLTFQNTLNIQNIIEPVANKLENYDLHRFVSGDVVPGALLVFKHEFREELEIVRRFYNGILIQYFGSLKSEGPSDVVVSLNDQSDYYIMTSSKHFDTLRSELETRNQHIVYLIDNEEITCEPPLCVYFNGFNSTVKDLNLRIRDTIEITVKHTPTGRPVLINPACYDQCECIDIVYKEPEQRIEKHQFSASYYTERSRYFKAYALSIYDALMDGTLQHQNFEITQHPYVSTGHDDPHCYTKTSQGFCVYDPKLVELNSCVNLYNYTMQCPPELDFCNQVMQTQFCKPGHVVSTVKTTVLQESCSKGKEVVEHGTPIKPTPCTTYEKVEIFTGDYSTVPADVLLVDESKVDSVEEIISVVETQTESYPCSNPHFGNYVNLKDLTAWFDLLDASNSYKHVILPFVHYEHYDISSVLESVASYMLNCRNYTWYHHFERDSNRDQFRHVPIDKRAVYAYEFSDMSKKDFLDMVAIFFDTVDNGQYKQYSPALAPSEGRQHTLLLSIELEQDWIRLNPKQRVCQKLREMFGYCDFNLVDVMFTMPYTLVQHGSYVMYPKRERTELQNRFEYHINRMKDFANTIYSFAYNATVNVTLTMPSLPTVNLTLPTMPTVPTVNVPNPMTYLSNWYQAVIQPHINQLSDIYVGYDRAYPRMATYYRDYIDRIDESELCEVLHHADTVVMYRDCIANNMGEVILEFPRFGPTAFDFQTKVVKNLTRENLKLFITAIGYTYREEVIMLYRPLFTDPYQVVPSYHIPNLVQYCFTEEPNQIRGTPFSADNTQCFPKLTGLRDLDQFLSCFVNYQSVIAILLVFFFVPMIMRTFRYETLLWTRFGILTTIFVVKYLHTILRVDWMFGNLLWWITSVQIVPNSLTGIKVVTHFVYIIALLSQAYTTLHDLQRTWDIKFMPALCLTYVELAFYGFDFYQKYFLTNVFSTLLLGILGTGVLYTFRDALKPAHKRKYVTLQQAANDWCAFRDSQRTPTDSYARTMCQKPFQDCIGSLDVEKLLKADYLLQCYNNTVGTTFNPKECMLIKQFNVNEWLARNTTHLAENRSQLQNQNAYTNSSQRYVVPGCTPEMNPKLTFLNPTTQVRSILYGAIVDGYLYIERHMFGGDKETFLKNYADGEGLTHVSPLPQSIYNIAEATLYKTMIKVPLHKPQPSPFKKHPDPNKYTGPVQMYVDTRIVHGFIQEGHHDICTQNGDCGGMLFTLNGEFLGLHCAGSLDVVFADNKNPTIWTGYKNPHPSEIMITLDSDINLPGDTTDYDFTSTKVIYKHPLRAVVPTLQTLQHITNSSNEYYPYDKLLYRDFSITEEDYLKHKLYVNYPYFVNNFKTIINHTLGSNSLEFCLKYGIKQIQFVHRQLQNHAAIEETCKNTWLVLSLKVALFLFMSYAHYYASGDGQAPTLRTIMCGLIWLLVIALQTYYPGLTLVLYITEFIIMTTQLYHYALFIGLHFGYFQLWPVKGELLSLRSFFSQIKEAIVYYTITNQNTTEEAPQRALALRLGTKENLCAHLSTVLKILKPNSAFSKLTSVTNELDDLRATWGSDPQASTKLDRAITEIYALYPVLFTILTKVTDYDTQIQLLASYIGERGDFDLDNFETKYQGDLAKAGYTTIERELVEESDEIVNTIDTPDMQTSLTLVSKAKEMQTIDISTIDDQRLPELITTLINYTEDITKVDVKLINTLADRIVCILQALRADKDEILKQDFAEYFLQLRKYKDFFATTVTGDMRQRNIVGNTFSRIIAQLSRCVNAQEQTRAQIAAAAAKIRQKESSRLIQEANKNRKLQRQNQNIAVAILHMVHACLANRFMLQNQVSINNWASILPRIAAQLRPLGIETLTNEDDSNVLITNEVQRSDFVTLQSTLWTGNVYAVVTSICGKTPFVCSTDHKHSHYNCNKSLFPVWYKHVSSCQECMFMYNNGTHPICGRRYDDEIVKRTKRPTYLNFLERYRSCPDCIPCTTCVVNRDTHCDSPSYHFEGDETAPKMATNQSYLTPVTINPAKLEYNTSPGKIDACFNNKPIVTRFTACPVSVPAKWRPLTRIRSDPDGFYYVTENCPNDISILNATINAIIQRLGDIPPLPADDSSRLDPGLIENQALAEPENYATFTTTLSSTELAIKLDEHPILVNVILNKDFQTQQKQLVSELHDICPSAHILCYYDAKASVNVINYYVNHVSVSRLPLTDEKGMATAFDTLSALYENPPDFCGGRKH